MDWSADHDKFVGGYRTILRLPGYRNLGPCVPVVSVQQRGSAWRTLGKHARVAYTEDSPLSRGGCCSRYP
jgi:hypothetical protein